MAQPRSLALNNANLQMYQGKLYCYGLSQDASQLTLRVFRMNAQLLQTDSLTEKLSFSTADSYLQVWSDSLHGFLNIYLQKKESQTVDILRINNKLEIVSRIEKVSITRLNNSAMFQDEPIYNKNSVYSIREIKDSAFSQFYLNKYELIDPQLNFEYKLKWQFPFYKKDVTLAKVFYADDKIVFIYADRRVGDATSQWILKVNSSNGTLIKAIKISEKEDASLYHFANFIFNTRNKELFVCGQKTQKSESDPFKINDKQTEVSLWNCLIDSSDEFISRASHTIPVILKVEGASKKKSNIIFKINRVTELSPHSYTLESDLYKISTGESCYKFCNTLQLKLDVTDQQSILSKVTFSAHPEIEYYFRSNDKLDVSGKLCNDNLEKKESLFFERTINSPRPLFTTDKSGISLWVLKKFELKSNSINYTFLKAVNGLYKLENIVSVPTVENPNMLITGKNSFIISRQLQTGYYQISPFIW